MHWWNTVLSEIGRVNAQYIIIMMIINVKNKLGCIQNFIFSLNKVSKFKCCGWNVADIFVSILCQWQKINAKTTFLYKVSFLTQIIQKIDNIKTAKQQQTSGYGEWVKKRTTSVKS